MQTAKKKKKEEFFSASIKLQSIELLNSSVTIPADSDIEPGSTNDFRFKIKTKINIEPASKLIKVLIDSVVTTKEKEDVDLGKVTAVFHYEIENFNEVFKSTGDSTIVDVPKSLIDRLNELSVDTCRGIVFSTFKGTVLHNAIIPIIEFSQFAVKRTPPLPESTKK